MALVPRIEPETDAELMARVGKGDERALGELYDRHSSLVYTLAHAIVHRSADAEEVTEDVFVQVWTTSDRFDPGRGALKSWLATIARSRALDHVRARKRLHSAHDRSAAADADGMAVRPAEPEPTDAPVLRDEVRSALDRALSNLNADQRHAIELAYFGGLSQTEIADRLDEPLGTVKTRIRDGMKKLRDAFAGSGGLLA